MVYIKTLKTSVIIQRWFRLLESEHQYNFLSKTFILLPIPNYESRKVIIANSITPIFVKMFYDYMKNNFI